MKVLPNLFYYLDNFHQVLDWITGRYSDLLLESEKAWISSFRSLPRNARAMPVAVCHVDWSELADSLSGSP